MSTRNDDAVQLLAELRAETARLRDPTQLQFIGSDAAADERTAAALQQQLDGVAELPAALGAPTAEVTAVLGDYGAAVRAALHHVRTGAAPPLSPRSLTPAPGGDDPTPGTGDVRAPSTRLAAGIALVIVLVIVALFLALG